MSAPIRSSLLVSRLGRLAALGAAVLLLLVFRAEASAQELPAVSAGSSPLQVTVVQKGGEVQRVQFEDGWVMEVRSEPVRQVLVNGQSYAEVYESVPYRRTEYLANPGYRHDTTIELLSGQLRPTVIHRNDTPERIVNPRPEMYSPYIPSRSDFWATSGFRFLHPFMPLNPLPTVMGALP